MRAITRSEDRIDRRSLVLGGCVIVVVVVVVAYVVLRSRPMLNTDYEAFLFVGSRILQGDRLYVDVWDNKDPLTYWVSAAVVPWLPISAHVVEGLWLALIGVATFFLAQTFRLPSIVALLAGGTLGPLSVLTLDYFPGATEIPGVAITLIALALAFRQHNVLAGTAIGVLVFAKIIFVPVAIATVAVWIISKRQLVESRNLILGFLGTTTVFLLVLAARDEILGYVETLLMNVFYSNVDRNMNASMELSGAVSARIALMFDSDLVHAAALLGLVFLAASLVLLRRQTQFHGDLTWAWLVCVAALVSSVAVLAVTAKSPHHLLLLSVPVVLCSLFSVSVFMNSRFAIRHLSNLTRLVLVSCLVVGLAVVSTGVVAPTHHKFLAEYGWSRSEVLFSRGTVVEWLRENPQHTRSPLQFVGDWKSVPITSTDTRWVMGCRYVGQGSWTTDDALQEGSRCLDKSQIIFVADPAPVIADDAAYDEFWRGVTDKLSSEFRCSRYQDIDVCFKRDISTL